jgi:type IV pilus assembly protein PilY1
MLADVRGDLYRIDLPTTGDRTDPATWSAVSAVKIASLGGKVFFAPDVVVTKSFVAVLVGTGDREKPLLNTTADRFFLIRDNVGATPVPLRTISDLALVASVDNATMTLTAPGTPVSSAERVLHQSATNGEKTVNAPFTIAGRYLLRNEPAQAGEREHLLG